MSEGIRHWNNVQDHKDIMASRVPFLEATRQAVIKVMDDYFLGGFPILELGSGMGVLSKLTAPKYNTRMISLDQNRTPYLSGQNLLPFVQADIFKLPFEDQSFLYSTGLAFLSSMSDIKSAASEIRRTLKPRGIFIHFLDILPDFSPLVNDMIGQNILPFLNYDVQGKMIFSCIDKSTFFRRFDRGKMIKMLMMEGMTYPQALIVGNKYVHYSVNPLQHIKDFFKLSMLNYYSGSTVQAAIIAMVRNLKRMKISLDDTAPIDEVYGRMVVKHFQNADFSRVEMDYVTGNITLPIELCVANWKDPHIANHLNCIAGNPYLSHSQDVEKGKMFIQSNIQVIIAQR